MADRVNRVDRVGQQFGNYRLIRLLGEGGFAEVYLGEHIDLGTQAAIKVLSMQLAKADVDQFRSEARTIARLLHPNIVRILDFGMQGRTPFIVMDYAPYGSLRQNSPKGVPLAAATIVSYVKQVADALQYAHQEKLIHRDIKPENMLVGRNKEVWLSDFGLALMLQSSRSIDTGELAGTITYIAPEQIRGRPRQASDQYALGAVVYEWMSGEPPFSGSFTEVVAQHLTLPPPPLRKKIPSISPLVEQVVLRALEKDPERRFESVQGFARALEEASQTAAPKSLTSAPPVELWPGKAALPTLPAGSPSPLVPGARTQPVGTIVCTYRGHAAPIYTLSWSPDGTRIASGGDDKLLEIWDALTGEQGITCRGHSQRVRAVAWSPNSERILSGSEDKTVRMWYASTGDSIFSYRDPGDDVVRAVAWSPDGKRVAVSSGNRSARIWSVETNISLFTYVGHADCVTSLVWSPDGRCIASGGDMLDRSVQVWDAANGRGMLTYDHPAAVLSIAWFPDGKQVASGSEDGTIQKWDTQTASKLLIYQNGAAVRALAWSPDGTRFAFAGDDETVQVWDTTTNLRLFTYGHTAAVRAMAWSPDGKYIASGGDDEVVQVWAAPAPGAE